MKVRLVVGRAGVDFVQHIGDVIDLPKEEALSVIRAGHAVPVESKPLDRASKRKGK